jgi:hypothetical protein
VRRRIIGTVVFSVATIGAGRLSAALDAAPDTVGSIPSTRTGLHACYQNVALPYSMPRRYEYGFTHRLCGPIWK